MLEEKIAYLQLLKTPKIGRVTFFHLLQHFKSAQAAVEGFADYVARFNKKVVYSLVSRQSILSFLDDCYNHSVKLVFFSDPEYPQEFLLAPDFAPVLFCKGNISLFNSDCLAIVGSRTASLQGLSFTKKLVKDLNSLSIVSGFAHGIDSAAHEASLSSGTIAVLGSGINYVYPEENKILYSKILDNNGLIVSEVGLSDTPRPNFFAYRNRVISGLSKGILVIEAAMNSGSLITAKYAVEQGKNIFAVPGHPYDLRSCGTNYLIKNGAILVRNSDDILSEFHSYRSSTPSMQSSLFGIAEDDISLVKQVILDGLGGAVMSISEIVSFSKYSISSVNSALAELELSGLILIDQNLVSLVYI